MGGGVDGVRDWVGECKPATQRKTTQNKATHHVPTYVPNQHIPGSIRGTVVVS